MNYLFYENEHSQSIPFAFILYATWFIFILFYKFFFIISTLFKSPTIPF